MRRLIILGVSFSLLLALLQGTAGAVTFGPAKLISATSNNSRYPRVDMDGSRVVAVYERWLLGTPASAKVYRVVSNDGGATWGTPKKIYNISPEQHAPDVAVCGDRVYATWVQAVASESQVQFAYSTDGGQTFTYQGTIGVARDTVDILEDKPRVECYGTTKVWVAWADGNVEFRGSIDGGLNFLYAMDLEGDELITREASIANDGNNVYVAYDTDDPVNVPNGAILFQKSTNAGMSFSPEATITFHPGDGPHPVQPELAAFGKRIALAYMSGAMPDAVRTMVSVDRGASWPKARKVATGKSSPSIAAAAGRLDLVYADAAKVVHRSSTSDGLDWSAETTVASGQQMGAFGTAAVSTKPKWVAAWTQYKGNRDRIYVAPATP